VSILRAGVVGLGAMGRNHVRVLDAMPDVELAAVCDAAGDAYGVAGHLTVVSQVDQLIEAGLDLCVVATPTASHEEVAVALAEAGVPTLIEKPLASDTAAAERIRGAFERSGVIAVVGHVERYNPALVELRRRLAAGELGELYQVSTRRQSPFPPRIGDVGVVFDLATHDLDLTSWVTQRRYTKVSAFTAHKSGRAHEDLVAAVATLEDGLVVNHLVNWLTPMKERVTTVTGEQGCFIADTLNADLTLHRNGVVLNEWDAMAVFRGVTEGDMTRFAISKPEPLRTELETFVAAVTGSRDADVVTLDQGLDVIRVAEAALRSARTGQVEIL
jgi:UDP-N-acetylglucosamine 3-dehydrogenase